MPTPWDLHRAQGAALTCTARPKLIAAKSNPPRNSFLITIPFSSLREFAANQKSGSKRGDQHARRLVCAAIDQHRGARRSTPFAFPRNMCNTETQNCPGSWEVLITHHLWRIVAMNMVFHHEGHDGHEEEQKETDSGLRAHHVLRGESRAGSWIEQRISVSECHRGLPQVADLDDAAPDTLQSISLSVRWDAGFPRPAYC